MALEFPAGVDTVGTPITVDQAVGVGLGTSLGDKAVDWATSLGYAAAHGLEAEFYEGGLNYAGSSREAFSIGVSLDPRIGRLHRATIDRGFTLAGNLGCTLIQYGTTQANWSLWYDLANYQTPKYLATVQALADWRASPTGGASTAALPPLATVTAVTIDPVAAALLSGGTVPLVGHVAGANAPITAVTWAGDVSSVTGLGVAGLPHFAASPQTIHFVATSVADPTRSATIAVSLPAATGPAAPLLADPSFEANVGFVAGQNQAGASYDYAPQLPAGLPWAFANPAGMANASSDIARSNPAPGYGGQVGFIQYAGSISQQVAFPYAGTYRLGVVAAQRNFNSSAQVLQVLVDGVVVGTLAPASALYAPAQTAPFAVATGPHLLTLRGTATADHMALIDVVTLTLVAAGGGTPYVPLGAGWLRRQLKVAP